MNNKQFYEAPAATVLELKEQGIICSSASFNISYPEEDWTI